MSQPTTMLIENGTVLTMNATDEIIARNNVTSSLTALQLVTSPASTSWYNASGGGNSALSPATTTPVKILSVLRTAPGTVRIRCHIISGRRYRLEGTENPTAPAWQTVPTQMISTDRVGECEFWTLEYQDPSTMFYRLAAE